VKRRIALLILTHVAATYAFWPLLLGTSQVLARPYTIHELWHDRLLVLSSPLFVPRGLWFVTFNRPAGLALCVWASYLLPLFPAYWLLNRILPRHGRWPGILLEMRI